MNGKKWELKASGPRGKKLYEFEMDTYVASNRWLFKGILEVANKGRGTARIVLERWCSNFYGNYRFGFRMIKNFKGHNASHSARAWFRHMKSEKYCPEFLSMLEEEKEKYEG